MKTCLVLILLLPLHILITESRGNEDKPYLCKVKEFSSADGLTQEHIVDFVQDRQGFVWFGTWNGLVRYDGYRFHTFKPVRSLVRSNRVIRIRLYKDGNIWCSTYDNRLHIFDTKRCMFIHSADAEKCKGWEKRSGMEKIQRHGSNISYKDHYGNYIIWNKGQPLTCINPQTKVHFTIPIYGENGYIPYHPDVENYAVDNQGNLWLIMSRKLARITFYPNWFHHQSNGSGTETRALFRDKQGQLWTGCKDGTLKIWNKEMTAARFLTSQGKFTSSKAIFSHSNVYAIYCDQRQRIWIGTKGDGLYCLTPTGISDHYQVKHFAHSDADKSSLSSNDVYAITEDQSHRIWVGTWTSGVDIVDEHNDISFINRNNNLRGYPAGNSLKVRCLHGSSDGTMYIGTAGGLVTVNGKNINHVLAGSDIMQILSAKGKIYLCIYSKGITEIATKGIFKNEIRIKSYDSSNNTNDCYINAIYDGRSSIWLFSESSVMRFNTTNHRFSVYDEENFGERYYFSEAKLLIDSDGAITAGTEEGLFSFNPAIITCGNKAPHIAISGIQYQGENFIRPINDLEQLTLAPSQRSITLFLSTPNQSEATKTSFVYMMEGYDKSWNYLINGHSISYANLPPGEYTLKICVSNAEGNWANDIRIINVTVQPLFTETIWFVLLMLLIFIVIIGVVFYVIIYIRSLRMRQRELLAYIEQNMQKSKAETPTFTPPSIPDYDKEFLDKFTETFLANICNSDMSIDDFATELGMSHAAFYRKIKQLVGVTPVDFIRRLRVKRALQYLDAGERQISDVAYKTGFSDPKYFSRCFKTEMGCTPSEYCQKKDGPPQGSAQQ